MYFERRKDATQVIVGLNGKMCRSTQLEEHYVLVGKPGTYYLTHLSPIDGKVCKLAQEIFEFIFKTVCEKLTIIVTNGTALMTGKFNGTMHSLEELLKNPLQWSICLFHANDFPFNMFLWNLMAQPTALIALLDPQVNN